MIKSILTKVFKNHIRTNHAYINPEYFPKEKEYNAGYEIIAKACVNSTEIVLGKHIENSKKYVTWKCTHLVENIKMYHWGNYFDDRNSAILDFNRRVKLYNM